MSQEIDFNDPAFYEIPKVEIIVPFKKHKGKKLEEVAHDDPKYLIWAKEETSWGKANIPDSLYEELKHVVEQSQSGDHGMDRADDFDFFEDIKF
jgi:hypothetical protein